MEAAGEGGRTAALAWHQYRRGPEEARGFVWPASGQLWRARPSALRGATATALFLFVSSVPRPLRLVTLCLWSFVWTAGPIIVQNLILVRGTTLAVP
jgi:hypothetical protein